MEKFLNSAFQDEWLLNSYLKEDDDDEVEEDELIEELLDERRLRESFDWMLKRADLLNLLNEPSSSLGSRLASFADFMACYISHLVLYIFILFIFSFFYFYIYFLSFKYGVYE